jgi:hypothetical protein
MSTGRGPSRWRVCEEAIGYRLSAIGYQPAGSQRPMTDSR